jgi:hypothetical protein
MEPQRSVIRVAIKCFLPAVTKTATTVGDQGFLTNTLPPNLSRTKKVPASIAMPQKPVILFVIQTADVVLAQYLLTACLCRRPTPGSRIPEDGDEAMMDASDAEAVKAEENEGDEDWVVVPGYSLPSPPTPSFPVKTHTPHYSPGQLKGEYRRKMVKEVLPELMGLYVLSLRLVLTLANLLADSLTLESAPLVRFGGV